MKKQTRKKLTAWLLSIAMTLSMVIDVLPAAYADGEGDSAPITNWDFGDSTVTGRPRLFVDFLGDNGQYKAVNTEVNNPGGLLTPGDEDQSNITNPGKGYTWEGYSQADTVSGQTIFWVGVGIDNMSLLDLFQRDDRGIYSAELGFYYDSTIIEPYTGPNDNYLEVIRAANLENYTHKWGDQYSIVAAESGLDPQKVLEPQVDPVTQEVISQPSVSQIVGDDIPNHPTSDWKMTYVSLEKTGDGLSRFHGEAQTGTEAGTQYIMLIPFRLKGYNGQYDHRSVGVRDRYVCLRLIRNASLFSIGGGSEGVEPYGAWERVTTRNPGKDLKLMVDFQGDLDIFGGRRYLEDPYHANLVIEGNYVGTGNLAELYITGDPSPNKGKVSTNGARIDGLYGGTGLTLDVTCQSIYSVEVWVCPEGDTTKATLYPLTKVDDNTILSHYNFLMPEGNVDVHVLFNLDPDVTDFWLYLNEQEVADPQGRPITGNSTVVTATYTPDPNPDGSQDPDVVTKVDKDSPRNNFLGLPAEQVHMGAAVEIDIKVHKDYEAYVEVVNVHNGRRIALDNLPGDHVLDTDTVADPDKHLAVILPTGGTITVRGGMPQSDMEVRVTYRPATRYRATLEVWHDNGAPVLATNVAQLENVVYSADDVPMTSYSGVVYHDDTVTPENHSAVEQASTGSFRVLGKVDASSAALSGSLGGDGRKAVAWDSSVDSIMTVAWEATSAAAMVGRITPLDLRAQDVMGTPGDSSDDGLRKNAAGEFYTDGDISDFYDRLYEIAQLARIEGIYRVDDPTATFTYFGLSMAQVQMYLLDYALTGSATTLRTPGDALTQLAAYTWPAPDPNSVPKTANDTAYLDVRGGRRVVVTLESDSVYTTLSGVRLLTDEADPTKRTLITTVQPQRDPDYQNVYYFDMPTQDCIVEVTYTQRPVHDLGLTIDGDSGEADNNVHVTGYTPDPGKITAKAETISTDGSHIENVLEGSTVTVDVKVADGYEVWVDVIRGTGVTQQTVYSLPVTAVNTSFTFVMPSEDSVVQVHYRETDKKRNNANVVISYYPGTTADSSNQAWWEGTNPHATRKASVEGEELTANLSIAKNYYIYAVRTYTTSEDNMNGPYIGAGYPFLLSGNGWNNGPATVDPVTLDTVMPDAEYWVEVILREGPPVPEPEQSLSLQVKDEQNEEAPYADNYASAVASGGTSLGPVGKARSSAYDTGFAMAGETVKVEFHPAAGYYVESVEVLPASLGVAVAWTSATTAEFTMPAGSAAVVVTFQKGSGSSTRLFLDLAKTEQSSTPGETSADNTVNYFRSPTTWNNTGLNQGRYTVPSLPGRYPSGDSTTGAARPGETVELEIQVEQGWYVHSLSVSGSSGRLPYQLYSSYDPGTNTGVAYNAQTDYSASAVTKVTATFVMPNSDAAVVVNYRKGEPPAKQTDYVMELRVSDPENISEPLVDNYAVARIVGENGESVLGPVGKVRTPNQLWDMDYAQEGDTVTISYGMDVGFSLDVIIVSSTGRRVPVTYLGGGGAQFTMPAGDVTALVCFKAGAPNQYTANLVLHMPPGTALEDYDSIGEGSFGTTLSQIYSMIAIPGQDIDLSLWAKDGYFIRTVTVAPEALGVEATYSGSFGRQSGSLVMPAGNIQVNVYFEKGWPDTVKEYPDTVNYNLTLEVYDIPDSGSTANFHSIAGTTLTAPESDPVAGGERKTLKNRAYDDDLVEVALNSVEGYVPRVTITDSRGVSVPWRYVPGGIAFEMPPAHVTVTVRYEKIPPYDPGNPDDPNYPEMLKVTLHIQGGDATDRASLTYNGTTPATTVNWDGGTISLPDPPGGQTLTLSATPGAGHSIVTAYAVSESSGEQLIIPISLVPGGGTVDFAMPKMDNAHVYVIFDPTMEPPSDDQRLGTLQVVGPNGSGSAQMTAAAGVKPDTGVVPASGGSSLFAPQSTLLTVDLTVESGYSIAAIRVTDGQGNRVPYTWTDGSQRQFTFAMPVTGVHVYVEYEDVTTVKRDLTAQVVVNNGGNPGNTAKLRLSGTAVGSGSAYLSGLGPGDAIDLDLVVQPGFEVEYIKVTPVKYGIAPSLYQPATEDQTTSFTMPGESVVIYVRFKEDTRLRRPVTLVVEGDSTPGNEAYIHSNYSGSKGPVTPGNSDSVRAAPPTATLPAEWVTVDYEWADGCSVKSITVLDANGDPVPFTQNKNDPSRKGQLVFPMVNSDVVVTIVYQNDPNPPTFDAILHVIDLDDPAASNDSWGKLTWTGTGTWAGAGTTTGDIYSHTVGSTGNPGEEILKVPGGETVTVDALAETGTYIKAAYVLYRSMGQMINFNFGLPTGTVGFQGAQQDSFTMPYGQADVYIYFTKVPPTTNDYAAVLMLESPSADTTSTATITNDNARPTQIGTATVTANTLPDHGYVTATDGDTITVTVHPATGYVIDSILMTPLGIAVEQGGTVALTQQPDGSYTFTMPAQNVAVRVKLRRGSSGDFRVTLHYRMWNGDQIVEDPKKTWAMLSFADDSNPARWDTDGEFRMVPELAEVTLGVSLDDPNLVLAAYALQEPGVMVPFTGPALEGTVEGNSLLDDTLTDAETTFIMPAADVDVFVWFIDKNDPHIPDIDKWHTAVLVVTDDDGTTGGVVNSGKNSASIKSDKHNPTPIEVWSNGMITRGTVTGNVSVGDNVLQHSYIWVEEGETVTVKIETIHEDYSFVRPVTYTRSDVNGTYTPLEDSATAPNYVYTYPVETYNTTARAHFTASDIKESALNVVIIDRDNPGNGSVINSVRVTPDGMPALTVNSTTSAGARQRIHNVPATSRVDFVVNPDSTEYTAVIRLLDSDGNLIQTWYNYIDNFHMPNQAATLEVTFFKGRQVTLSVWDTRGVTTDVTGEVSKAQMTESAFSGTINADSTRDPASFGTPLPDGTVLAASITELADDTRLIGALVLYPNGTAAWLPSTSVAGAADEYRYTISGNDVEIRMVVGPIREPGTRDYMASVSAVNLPAGTDVPEIHVTPTPNPSEGSGWTVAKPNDTVTVTLDVPYGYRAELTTTTVSGVAVTIAPDAFDGTDGAITDATASFTMPASNTHVTVRYVKTRFTATIKTAGNGSGTATLTANLIGGGQTTVTANTTPDTIRDLRGSEQLDYTAVANTGSLITGILMTKSNGSTQYLSHTSGVGSVTMPEDDVTITVIFTKQQTTSHYLDLHVSGTGGGSATLVAEKDGVTIGTGHSDPTAPRGLSRIEKVEAGSDVTLTVAPGSGYLVTVGYYLHNGGSLTYVSNTVTTTAGGEITFTMPSTNTCIYVTFRTSENPPVVPPDDPDHPDPNHYLDLHVSGTGGGTAVMTAAGVGTVQSTPTNPRSVSTIRPIGTGTSVTLEVRPEPGYTVMVSYMVYNNGVPQVIDLSAITSSGGTAVFAMPSQSTCVYVTFRGPDRLPYLDLHVTNPRGGEAILSTDGFGTLMSTPTVQNTFGRIDQVESGTTVTLNVKPGADYTVTVSYYRHDNGNLYYNSYLIDTGNGGEAVFDMPNTATCIYVTFRGPGDEPDPDPNDPEKYLDLHVSETQGGSATLTPAGMSAMTSTPTAPKSYDQRKPVEAGTSVTLDVKPLPGYTVSVSYYVHNGGTFTWVTNDVDSSNGGQATFDMPDQSTCIYVTFKRQDNPDPNDPEKYLDLHVSGLNNGSASLTTAETPPRSVSSTPAAPVSVSTIQPVAAGTGVTLEVKPEPGYVVTVSYYIHNGGSFTVAPDPIDSNAGGTTTFQMPDQSTCVYVHFHKPTDPQPDPDPPDPPPPEEPELHIAYVTLVNTDGEPLNTAQSIVNTTQNRGGGPLWAYGVAGETMLTTFTVAPGYKALVTARRLDTNAMVTVAQLGTTNSGTATASMPAMPDADLEVIITYSKELTPQPHNLTLRLVGHEGQAGNNATLTGGDVPLSLSGDMAPTGNNVQDTTKAVLGTPLDLDANRENGYIMWATLEYVDSNNVQQVIKLSLNEYGNNGTSLLFMPDADAIVTVYYRLPYEAMLLVIDAQGNDFDGNAPGDTTAPTATNVPNTELEVTDPAGASMGNTTLTHTKITGLYGNETVTTTVDKRHIADGGTLPDDASIASVVATTSSGTVHLSENTALSTTDTGIYTYQMSDLLQTPPRQADDVTITVILRDDTAEQDMYTATVYKKGHDDLPANSATIRNTTTSGLPVGSVWAGAYEKDQMQVDVGTAPGYYAIVTAKRVTGEDVYVLQWTTVGPFPATFIMPAADVDVTVEYVKEKPKANLTLELLHHGEEAENKGTVYNDASALPDPTATPTPNLLITANGGESLPAGAAPGSGPDPFSKTATGVDVGDYLTTVPEHADGYYIKSVTLTAGTFTFDLLNDTTFVPRLPVGGATITIEYAPGKQSGRPYDPEHAERYNAATVWADGNYVTGDSDPDKDNPDLTVAPMLGQQGWILAENPNADEKTVVVTVPTLYDDDAVLADSEALSDAGVDPAGIDTPPAYKFYWWDSDNGIYVPFGTDDLTITAERSLDYNENPKGDFPKADPQEEHHYGYRLTLQAKDGSASPLADYIENGGEIYVTATRSGYADADNTVPWTESLMTQVIIQNDDNPKPSDPDNTGSPIYEERWIYAQNWVDYLLVTVPTLDTDGKHPISVDGEHVSFNFYLGTTANRDPSTAVDVTNLLTMTNPNIYFANPDWEHDYAYPGEELEKAKAWTPSGYTYENEYENDVYYVQTADDGTKTEFHGARFVLKILTDEEIDALGLDATAKDNAELLREIWGEKGNYGTMNEKPHQYRLYISAVNHSGATPKESDVTDFEVPPYYTLSGILESYAPAHVATFDLYADLPEDIDVNQSDLSDLKAETPFIVYKQVRDWDFGSGLWQLEYKIRTSELLGDYTMLIEKAGHVSFVWQGMELSENTLDPADGRGLTFTVAGEIDENGNEIIEMDGDVVLPGVIALFGGDINGDRYVQVEDYTVLSAFYGGQLKQNRSTDETDVKKWANSVYNPESAAYKADLDGDHYVSPSDHAVWNTARNYNKNYTDYVTPRQLRTGTTRMLTAEEALLLNQELEPPPELMPQPGEEQLPEGEQPPEGELLPEEKDPTTEEKDPTTEEKDPTTEEKDPATEEKDPTTEEKDPATEEKDPTTEEKDPTTEEKDPTAEGKDPTTEEKDSVTEEKEELPLDPSAAVEGEEKVDSSVLEEADLGSKGDLEGQNDQLNSLFETGFTKTESEEQQPPISP